MWSTNRMAIKKTKNRKFEESLRDLRRRTRESVRQLPIASTYLYLTCELSF